jgi:hypothetical protein
LNTDTGTDEIKNDENDEKKDEPQRRREKHRKNAPLLNADEHDKETLT